MLNNLGEYWWILPPLLYLILLVVLIRRGMWERTGIRIMFATTCLLILLLPSMHRPFSYVMAVLIVLSLLILFREIFKSEVSSRPSVE